MGEFWDNLGILWESGLNGKKIAEICHMADFGKLFRRAGAMGLLEKFLCKWVLRLEILEGEPIVTLLEPVYAGQAVLDVAELGGGACGEDWFGPGIRPVAVQILEQAGIQDPALLFAPVAVHQEVFDHHQDREKVYLGKSGVEEVVTFLCTRRLFPCRFQGGLGPVQLLLELRCAGGL